MATDQTTPAVSTAGTAAAPGSQPVSLPVLVSSAGLLCVAVVGAFVSGSLVVVAGVCVVALLGVLAWGLGLRTFAQFFAVACCARPLVDLTAGPRGTGVSLTELFGVGVLFVMLAWLVVHRRELAARVRAPLPLALLALVAVYLLASVGSTDPMTGLVSTLRVGTGVAVFFVADLLLATRRLRPVQLLQILLLANVVPVLYPLLGLVGAPVTHQKDGITALRSVYFLSNNFAFALLPVLLLSIAVVLRCRGRVQWCAGAVGAVVAIELVLTETRGAWIAAAVGGLLVCALLNRRALLVAVAVLALVAVTVPSISERIADLAGDPDNPYSQSSFAWRLDQWGRLLPDVATNPVLGGGPGQAVRMTAKEPHNDYLKAGLETGAMGFGVYLWVLGASVAVSWRAWRRVRRRADREAGLDDALLTAGVAAVAAYSVAVMVGAIGENLVDNVTYLWATLPLFALAHWVVTAPDEHLRPSETPEGVDR